MNILLTGANGFIGRHLRQALEQDGHQVIVGSRQSGINFNQHLKPENWLPHLQNIDAVINAVGIIVEARQQCFDVLHHRAPVALFKACVQTGVKQVIQISALGADAQAFTPYQRSKSAADDFLRNSTLNGYILRPSLVYGAGGTSMAMFQRLATLPIIPLVGDAEYQVQPVHISDVVATVRKCLNQRPSGMVTLNVVGAEAISFKHWLQTIRKAAGKQPARTLAIPSHLMVNLAHIGRHLVPLLHPDNLRMLRAGNTADVTPLKNFLGRAPLTPEQGLALCCI